MWIETQIPMQSLTSTLTLIDTAPYALALVHALQVMASRQSNPVLEVIAGNTPLHYEQKYPEPALVFAQGCWCTYYHVHSIARIAGEHGHFHLFTRRNTKTEDWYHVAGLSMDQMGQPLRWFMVNRWVTGGGWFENTMLQAALISLTDANETTVLPQWLQAMVLVFSSQLAELCTQRDNHLIALFENKLAEKHFEDRAVYLLAEQPIQLLVTLESSLSGTAQG